MGHAKAIINIVDKKKQITLYQNIIQHNYSVRETEFIVKNSNVSKTKSSKYNPKILSTYFRKIEEELSNFLNQNVKLKVSKNGKGTIEIPFESEKKLDEIIKILQS